MQKWLLLISVFICGACVMVIELVGSRILAPFFGTTIFIWSSLIGVILGSMSFGYYIGGKYADKETNYEKYSMLFAICALVVAVLGISKNTVLFLVNSLGLSIAMKGLLAAIFLFVLPSVILAAIVPFAVRLSLNSVENSGKISGNIYAISTLGSITGTFLAGFYLIPAFGNSTIISCISITLILVSFAIYSKKYFMHKLLIFIVVIICAINTTGLKPYISGVIEEQDTKYGTILIRDIGGMRIMQVNNGMQSGRYLDNDELLFDYTKYYDLAFYFNPHTQKSLCIGGGGYSYPQYYLLNYPENEIDVVEIDHQVTELAKQYFGLQDDPRLNIINQDGRTFINDNIKKYDAIFGDAFNSRTPPYELLTLQANQHIYDALNDEGVFIVNIISALSGRESNLFSSVYATISNVFPNVYVFTPQKELADTNAVQNIMIVAQKSSKGNNLVSQETKFKELLKYKWQGTIPSNLPILTDDHSPVEFYTSFR